MADEISVTSMITVENGDFKFTRQYPSQKSDQAAQGAITQIQNIASSHEAIQLGDMAVGDIGWCCMRNLDATNNVTIGIVVSATYYTMLILKPGEFAQFRFDQTNVPYAEASASTVNLEYAIFKD